MALVMPADRNTQPRLTPLQERARIAVGEFRAGRVVWVDDEAASIEDARGDRFDLARDMVAPTVFARLKVGSPVEFRENAFHSIAELRF